MKQKTQEYVQYIKDHHKEFGMGNMNSRAISDMLGISQGRVSQLLKEIRGVSQPVNQEATASTAEA